MLEEISQSTFPIELHALSDRCIVTSAEYGFRLHRASSIDFSATFSTTPQNMGPSGWGE